MIRKCLSVQAREHAEQQHARAIAEFYKCAIENGADPRDRAQIAPDEARPIADANRDAREMLRRIERSRAFSGVDDAAAELAEMPRGHALSVALAFEGTRAQRASLRLAFDAQHRDELDSEHAHADELLRLARQIAERLRSADDEPLDLLEWIAGELAELGYDTSPPPELTDTWPVGPDGREYPPTAEPQA